MDTKISLPDLCIVKEHDAAGGKFGKPCLYIMAHSVISMQAVHMEQIDRTIGKARSGGIKGRLKKPRKIAVKWVVVIAELFQNRRVVATRLAVSGPRIHGRASDGDFQLRGRLAKSAIGITH